MRALHVLHIKYMYQYYRPAESILNEDELLNINWVNFTVYEFILEGLHSIDICNVHTVDFIV